jgi:hypothetical protein
MDGFRSRQDATTGHAMTATDLTTINNDTTMDSRLDKEAPTLTLQGVLKW